MIPLRRARRLLLAAAVAAAPLPAFVAAESVPASSPPEEAVPAEDSAARERIRVLRDAARSGREADIDAFVAFVSGYVRDHPASRLSGELRRDLPRKLKAQAHRAERLGEGRRALALYRIYERLPFSPPDREVARRREALESAFIAARVSPHEPLVAHESEGLAIPVRWPGSSEGVSGELHFRNRLSRQWRTVAVLPGPGGVLQAGIPAEEVVPPAIEYWGEAHDGAGTVRRFGSAVHPLSLRVLPR